MAWARAICHARIGPGPSWHAGSQDSSLPCCSLAEKGERSAMRRCALLLPWHAGHHIPRSQGCTIHCGDRDASQSVYADAKATKAWGCRDGRTRSAAQKDCCALAWLCPNIVIGIGLEKLNQLQGMFDLKSKFHTNFFCFSRFLYIIDFGWVRCKQSNYGSGLYHCLLHQLA